VIRSTTSGPRSYLPLPSANGLQDGDESVCSEALRCRMLLRFGGQDAVEREFIYWSSIADRAHHWS